MNKQLKIIALLISATSLAACSSSSQSKLDYQSANNKVVSL